MEPNEIRSAFYGLTGAGIIFVNSTIKLEIRMANVVDSIKPLFELPFESPLFQDEKNIFIIKSTLEERYLYL